MERTEESSGIWFWVFLAIIIFVLYCLVVQRPYCRTLDQPMPDRASQCVGEKPDDRSLR